MGDNIVSLSLSPRFCPCPTMATADTGETSLTSPGIHVALTHGPLDAKTIMDKVRSPQAGAIVLFAGTTRDSFGGRAVLNLSYQSYAPLALRTMGDIAEVLLKKHGLKAIAIVHRLGVVPVGEESILVAVSSPHRAAAWRAGEQCLEEVKARAEIWKLETFEDDRSAVWRANRDGVMGERVEGGIGVEPAVKDESEARGITSQLKGGAAEADGVGPGQVSESMGPATTPRRPGEAGHGAVVNASPRTGPQ
jgi:molybdopterin synthase catalytic subunit